MNNYHNISKLWASEDEIVQVELDENTARQKILDNGRCRCDKRLSELNAYNESQSQPRDVFEKCYHMRLLINRASYNHKLAVLKVQEKDLKRMIKQLKEEKHAAELRYVYTCPVPKPRRTCIVTRPKTSARHPPSIGPTSLLGTLHQELKTTHALTPLVTNEQRRKPIPTPRKQAPRRSFSQENPYQRVGTCSISMSPENLPPIEGTTLLQKPKIPPRTKYLSSPVKYPPKPESS